MIEPKPNPHGKPADQRDRQTHDAKVPSDAQEADQQRKEERKPPYEGTVTGGRTPDRGRQIDGK